MSQTEILRELLRRKQIEIWRRNPLLWLKERMGENVSDYQWSSMDPIYNTHQWDGDKDPLAEAWLHLGNVYNEVCQGYTSIERNVALESATGTGKTYWLARVVFWFLDCFENSLVVTSASSEKQLKEGLWIELANMYEKIKSLRPKAHMWKTRLIMEYVFSKGLSDAEKLKNLSESWHALAFTTGVESNEASANKARGFHREYMLIVLEECTGIPLPILTAFQNTSTGEFNLILAVGNPNNEFDTLHQLSQQKGCKHFRISAYDHPNIVLNKTIIPGAVSWHSINKRSDEDGEESDIFLRMVRGISPVASERSLIRIEWIESCIDKTHKDAQKSHNAVGVDVANSTSGDKASVAWGIRNTLVEVNEFFCDNATHLAYNIVMDNGGLATHNYTDYGIPTLAEYQISGNNIGVDGVGIGVATVNAFIDMGLHVQSLEGGVWRDVIPVEEKWLAGERKEVQMYSFYNLRAQMYWQLREDLRLKKININLKDRTLLKQLVKELCIIQLLPNNNRITLEGKEDIKKRLGGKSPNIADSIAYWNWARLGHRKGNSDAISIYGGR